MFSAIQKEHKTVNEILEIEHKNERDISDIKKLKNEIEELAFSLKVK